MACNRSVRKIVLSLVILSVSSCLHAGKKAQLQKCFDAITANNPHQLRQVIHGINPFTQYKGTDKTVYQVYEELIIAIRRKGKFSYTDPNILSAQRISELLSMELNFCICKDKERQ